MNKFKIGDRVSTNYGVGTVKGFESDGLTLIVELDKPLRGHSCGGKTKAEHGAYVSAELAKRIAPREIAPFKPGTQNRMLLDHLLSGRTITRIQADHLYRIASLTRRIRDLKDAGHKIISFTKIDPTGRQYVEYSLYNAGRIAA
jgi:hypothetical protein